MTFLFLEIRKLWERSARSSFKKKKKEEKKMLIKIGADFRSTLVSKAAFQVKDCVCVQVSWLNKQVWQGIKVCLVDVVCPSKSNM